jgi:hypothetical protein
MDTLTKTGLFIIGLVLVVTGMSEAQSSSLSAEKQIKAAVSAAPENLREGAKVMGYNDSGDLERLREGTNQLVCIADDPEQENFHVACYHKDLEPFMKRGRELKAKGFSRKKVDSLRRKEIEDGKIELPQKPMALYSLTGSVDSYDYSTGQVINASPLYVVYIPYATEETTGLSKKPPSKGAPWIMEPGTPWAHIMVMTGRDLGSGDAEENEY